MMPSVFYFHNIELECIDKDRSAEKKTHKKKRIILELQDWLAFLDHVENGAETYPAGYQIKMDWGLHKSFFEAVPIVKYQSPFIINHDIDSSQF